MGVLVLAGLLPTAVPELSFGVEGNFSGYLQVKYPDIPGRNKVCC
jgi:hypothetical protein